MLRASKLLAVVAFMWMQSACFSSGGGTNVGDPIGKLGDGSDSGYDVKYYMTAQNADFEFIACLTNISLTYLDNHSQEIGCKAEIDREELDPDRSRPFMNRIWNGNHADQSPEQLQAIRFDFSNLCGQRSDPSRYSLFYDLLGLPQYVTKSFSFPFRRQLPEGAPIADAPNFAVVMDLTRLLEKMNVEASEFNVDNAIGDFTVHSTF